MAVAISIVVHLLIFPSYSWNRDEPVYIWQVDTLREGKIRATDGGTPGRFFPALAVGGGGTV